MRALQAGGVVGAVSDVPASDFDQEPLDRNIADAEWLGPHAAAHQDVNAALLDAVDAVLPLAFGTIFRSEESVSAALGSRASELASALGAVRGRAEWVCTLDRDHRVASAHLSRTREAPAAGTGQGRAYLLRRKAEVETTEQHRALDLDAREALRAALAEVGEDVTEEALIEGGPAARFTVLVARSREDALRAAAERIRAEWAERGYDPRLSGPWPPYRYGAKVGVRA